MTKFSQKRREKKIKERCSALAGVLQKIRPLYSRASEEQKHFLETMIGAGIWYIPAPQGAWTGYISIESIKLFQNSGAKPTVSYEHVIPRKIAARELLKKPITEDVLRRHFINKYCKVHYVTPRENKVLMRFQRKPEFDASLSSYQKAGIRLVKVTNDELKKIKNGEVSTIKKLLKSFSADITKP